MISKKRVRRNLLEIIRLLRAGKTGFSFDSARRLSDQIEEIMEEHCPDIGAEDVFIRFNGKLAKCRFIQLPSRIFYIEKNGTYYINASKKNNIVGRIKNEHL